MYLRYNLFLLMLLTLSHIAICQDYKEMSGKLTSKERIPQGVRIINLESEQEVISDSKGDFKIFVKTDDVLVFSAVNFDYSRKIIEVEDYNKGYIIVNLTEKIEELEEVRIINYPNINAVSLGILSTPAKQYTPAERKLQTAGDFKWYYPLLIPFGGMPLDGLINELTGRTKMLKNNLKIERKILLIEKLEDDFLPSFYVKDLNINEDQVKAFQFFCAEDELFAKTMKSKNKTLIMFKLAQLATKFKEVNAKK